MSKAAKKSTGVEWSEPGYLANMFRDGLEVRKLSSASLVYLFNLTVLLILYVYYYVWTAYLNIEVDFRAALLFAVLSLLAIEYILTTFIFERTQKRQTHVRSGSVKRGKRVLLAPLPIAVAFLLSLITTVYIIDYFREGATFFSAVGGTVVIATAAFMFQPAEKRRITGLPEQTVLRKLASSIAVFLLVSIVAGAFVIKYVDTQKNHTASIRPNGTARISISVDNSKVSPGNRPVVAMVKTLRAQPLCFIAPVLVDGNTWKVSIDKGFINRESEWEIECYINPRSSLKTNAILDYYPPIGENPVLRCLAKRADLSVSDIQYDSLHSILNY